MENQTQTTNLPTHEAFIVENYKSEGKEKSFWTKIGSAWQHQDGNGFNLQLKAYPIDGKITIRKRGERNTSDSA